MNNTITTVSDSCSMTSGVYVGLHVIPKDCESIFENDRREHLNTLEKIALESALADFIVSYEEEAYGDTSIGRRNDICGYIRILDDCVDIMDGMYNTYEFDGMLIGEIWATNNDIIMMTAYRIPEEHADDWMDCEYLCEFEPVLIRLT